MRSAIFLAATLLLAGCAGSALDFTASAAHLTGAAPPGGITAQNQAALYLDAIDGLVKQERYGAALAFLDRYAVAENNPEPRYWLLRGDALLGLARGDEALAAFDKLDATAMAPQGWNGKGRAAAAKQDWDMATEDFRKAMLADPANVDFLNNLAFAKMRQGQGSEAVSILRQARELDPHSERVRNNLVIALRLSGDRDGAAQILNGIADVGLRAKLQSSIDALIPSLEKKS